MDTIYKKRRAHLAKKMTKDSVAFIPSAQLHLRNGDVHYQFRQDSDFYYLTGFNEPEAMLVIFSSGETILFNRAHDKLAELWEGKRLGQENACHALHVNNAFAIELFDEKLPELISSMHKSYLPLGRYHQWDKRILNAWQQLKQSHSESALDSFVDISPIISEMRLIKSSQELDNMQKAIDASISGHFKAMRAVNRANFEYELMAEINYEITRHGCNGYAYDPIVASGENACVLHYTDNNQPIKKGALVLIDAGGEYQNYASDITRTFPSNGKFSGEQKAIYDLVHSAQQAALACIKPGVCWNKMQNTVIHTLTSGLVDLGILKGDVDNLIEVDAFKSFYMHGFGHWIGLDVHDCGAYKINSRWRELQENMTFTVEPGIYINKQIKGIDSRWHGIGVRIEDDVCVTKEGVRVMSKALPSNADEIEAIINDG